MQHNFKIFFSLVVTVFLAVSLSGCTLVFQKGRRVDVDKISKLKTEVDALARAKNELEKSNSDLANVNKNLSLAKTDLEKAKDQLERRLSDEINDNQVTVQQEGKGLVITFVSEVLYASGKAELRNDSKAKLAKVANVLNTTVRDLDVGIEGHTDNVPIKHSKWASNWELSSARALSVVHYLIEDQGLEPQRLSASGYGEYRPVAANDSKEGRQQNRRVEIVILPEAEIMGR